MPTKLNPDIVAAAIEGFESQKRRIDDQIAELRAMLSGSPVKSDTTPKTTTPKRKKFSAAARKRMKAAQQLRWAKVKGVTALPVAKVEPEKPKHRISEEGMKRIIAATKKRWAKKRAEAAKAKPAAKKAARKKAAVKKTAASAAAS